MNEVGGCYGVAPCPARLQRAALLHELRSLGFRKNWKVSWPRRDLHPDLDLRTVALWSVEPRGGGLKKGGSGGIRTRTSGIKSPVRSRLRHGPSLVLAEMEPAAGLAPAIIALRERSCRC